MISARQINELTLATNHNAKLLLKSVMSGSIKSVKETLEICKKDMGEDYWKLILVKIPGVEAHNRRKWESVSSLEFAAFSGSLNIGFSDKKNEIFKNGYILNLLLDQIPLQFRLSALDQLQNVLKNGTEHGGVMAATKNLIWNGYAKVLDSNSQYEHLKIYTLSGYIPVVGGQQKKLTAFELLMFANDKMDWDMGVSFERFECEPPVCHWNLMDEGLGETWAIYRGQSAKGARRVESDYVRGVLPVTIEYTISMLRHIVDIKTTLLSGMIQSQILEIMLNKCEITKNFRTLDDWISLGYDREHAENYIHIAQQLNHLNQYKQRFDALERVVQQYTLTSPKNRSGLFAGQVCAPLREINRKIVEIQNKECTSIQGLRSIISSAGSMGAKHPILTAAQKCLVFAENHAHELGVSSVLSRGA